MVYRLVCVQPLVNLSFVQIEGADAAHGSDADHNLYRPNRNRKQVTDCQCISNDSIYYEYNWWTRRDKREKERRKQTHWEYCRLRKIGLIFDWNGI